MSMAVQTEARRSADPVLSGSLAETDPEVHAAIRGAVAYQYFFGPQARPVPSYGLPAPTWRDVESLIGATLRD